MEDDQGNLIAEILDDFSDPVIITESGFAPGTEVCRQVRASVLGPGGIRCTSDPAGPICITTTGGLEPPTNFSGTALSSSAIEWTWDDATGEDRYELHDQFGNVIITGISANSTSVCEIGLSPNTTVTRQIVAFSGDTDLPSNLFTVTTQQLQLQTITVAEGLPCALKVQVSALDSELTGGGQGGLNTKVTARIHTHDRKRECIGPGNPADQDIVLSYFADVRIPQKGVFRGFKSFTENRKVSRNPENFKFDSTDFDLELNVRDIEDAVITSAAMAAGLSEAPVGTELLGVLSLTLTARVLETDPCRCGDAASQNLPSIFRNQKKNCKLEIEILDVEVKREIAAAGAPQKYLVTISFEVTKANQDLAKPVQVRALLNAEHQYNCPNNTTVNFPQMGENEIVLPGGFNPVFGFVTVEITFPAAVTFAGETCPRAGLLESEVFFTSIELGATQDDQCADTDTITVGGPI